MSPLQPRGPRTARPLSLASIRAAEQRFRAKVFYGGSECHVWIGSITRYGYGAIRINGRERLAHRVAWSLSNGELPEGGDVLHSCANRRCVNPEHLRIGNQRDNNADRKAHGHYATGDAWRAQRRSA